MKRIALITAMALLSLGAFAEDQFLGKYTFVSHPSEVLVVTMTDGKYKLAGNDLPPEDAGIVPQDLLNQYHLFGLQTWPDTLHVLSSRSFVIVNATQADDATAAAGLPKPGYYFHGSMFGNFELLKREPGAGN
jgi:hypothetical protein